MSDTSQPIVPGASFLTTDLARTFRYARPNPVANFSVANVVQWRTLFRRGFLRQWSLFWHELEESADMRLAAIVPKRRAGVAKADFEIVCKEDSAEANLHREALEHFYSNLCVRDAIELDREGDVRQLLRDVADGVFTKYTAHEIVWRARGADLAAELIRCPLEFLQNRGGCMTWAGPYGAVIDGPRLMPGEWLITTHEQCLSFPLAQCYVFKSFSLTDWLNYNQGYSEPTIYGNTPAAYNSAEWKDAEAALGAIGTGVRALFGQGVTLNTLELGDQGAGIFKPLYDLADQHQIVLVMGSDLSTMAKHNATGASLQQDDKDILVVSDLTHVSSALHRGLDRHVIRLVFGEGVQPLAEFRLKPPVQKDVKGIMEKQKHLREIGVPQSIQQVAEELDHALPTEGDELIDPPAPPVPAVIAPAANAIPAAEIAPQPTVPGSVRQAVHADLRPLRDLIATALQPQGKTIDAADWDRVAEAMMQDGELENALNAEWLIALIEAAGGTLDQARALIAEVTQPTTTTP